jgi:hypothetical protein
VLPNCLLFSQFSKNSVAPNLLINPQSPIASPCPVSGQDTSVSAALLIPADNVSTQFIVLPALASGGLLLCSALHPDKAVFAGLGLCDDYSVCITFSSLFS